METYISLLRGVNVSGKNRIKMTDLQQVYESLGMQHVQTYIQSGNVVFSAANSTTEELEQMIAKGISNKLGLSVPVFVLKTDELEEIFNKKPFLSEFENESNQYIAFLSKVPEKLLVDGIEKASFLPDRFIWNKRALYLYLPNGAGRTKLNNNYFEKKLKVTATSRNLNTLTKLLNLAKSIEPYGR